ncbi:hypothetical protein K458DRAFT_361484 [Lentithecium fluviatile CBS 122367]|uniref:DUF7704 domain-containing protein n=1 Tax=Lentithecium fluviatile CBS 122367 TaxID=1168545 RepID=A0A6G1JAB3_9PLEO|nr:hypothetical protein K458DRAFT_361484 [Lentithecium fluviatile CBS 122367]
MALGTTLPFYPALIFTYLEPIALIGGFQATIADPSQFVLDQLPVSTTAALTPVPRGALILSYSVGNIYLLLAAFAVICTLITREARVTKWYLGIIALGDLGHIYSSYRVMGPEIFWDYEKYNGMMWGNIAFSVFLHVHRVLTLLGVFGKLGRR